jgi:hypothetical protein
MQLASQGHKAGRREHCRGPGDPALAGTVNGGYHANVGDVTSRLWGRQALRVAVLFLVVRVLVDLATPLLPGAFRLDPNESIEVAAASYQATSSAAMVQLPMIARRAVSSSLVASRSTAVPSSEPRVARDPGTTISRISYLTEPRTSSPSPDGD